MSLHWLCGVALFCTMSLVTLHGAETYQQRLAMADANDPHEMFELAEWCKENNLIVRYRQHLNDVIALDPNHFEAREALGFVYYNNQWTHRSRVPRDVIEREDTARRQAGTGDWSAGASGPAPTAEEVDWDLSIGEDPSPGEADWVNQHISAMSSAGHMSREMERAYRTLLMERYLPSAIHHLKHALKGGTFRGMYGVTMMFSEVWRERDPARMRAMRELVPFLVKASEKISDEVSLEAFCMIMYTVNERKAVPRLIQILRARNESVEYAARSALSSITLLPLRTLSAEDAEKWWARYHSAPEKAIYGELLNDRDINIVLQAAERMIPEGYRQVIPVLLRVLEHGDNRQMMIADGLMQRLTDSNWVNVSMTDDERKRRVAFAKNWWEDNKNSFEPAVIRQRRESAMRAVAQGQAEETPQTRVIERIRRLNDTDELRVSSAQTFILNQEEAAIAPLIQHGLTDNSGIIRQRSDGLLQELTDQNFGYEGLVGSDEDREAARQRWAEWARQEGHMDEATFDDEMIEEGVIEDQTPSDYRRGRQPLPF